MRVHAKYKTAVIMIVFGLLTVAAIAMGPLIQNRKNIANSEATSGCFCNDQDKCYPDGCTRKPIKSDGSIDYGRCDQVGGNPPYGQAYDTNSVEVNRYFCLQQPPCCAEMFGRNDPEACCWPEKGYCYPTYCTPETTANNNCGWYWSFHDNATPNGYGCMKGDSPSTMQPIFGLPAIAGGGQQPTNTPQPPAATNTQVPARPTNTPIPQIPTNTPFPPTHTPAPNAPSNTPYPTIQNTLVPTQQIVPTSAPSGNQPIGINPQEETAPKAPKEPFNMNILPDLPSKQEVVASLETTTAKPLAVVNTSYDVIVSADRRLESFATSWIDKFRVMIVKIFR